MKRAKIAFLLGLLLSINFCKVANGSKPPFTTRGIEIFTLKNLGKWGGVILQGVPEFRHKSGKKISPKRLKITLGPQGELESKDGICIVFKKECYEIDIPDETAVHLAKWVLTNQTGAFTAIPPKEGEQLKYVSGNFRGGYMPLELAHGEIPKILSFVDYNLLVEPIDDTQIKKKYNDRLGPDFNPLSRKRTGGSFLKTDTDTPYMANLTNGKIEMSGVIHHYSWVKYDGVEYPYIKSVMRACTPASIKANKNTDCSGSKQIYQIQKEAFNLINTIAIFRRIADEKPKNLRNFIKQAESQ